MKAANFSGLSGANYNETYIYDSNDNINSLQRYGKKQDNSFGIVDDLTYGYNGNQLIKVDDIGSQTDGFSDNGTKSDIEYTYDANGNMNADKNKNITNIQYNTLSLPNRIQVATGSNNIIDYIYDAAAIKLQKRTASSTTDYIGNFIYEDGVLKYILTGNGRIVVNGNNYSYQYFIKCLLRNKLIIV